jgi:hypothetical protein
MKNFETPVYHMWNICFFPLELLLHNYKCGGYVPTYSFTSGLILIFKMYDLPVVILFMVLYRFSKFLTYICIIFSFVKQAQPK